MAPFVISDNDRAVSVIVDDATGRAYGYIVQGGDHAEICQGFLDSLGTNHPGLLLPHEFDTVWNAYLEAVEEAVTERDAEPADEPAGAIELDAPVDAPGSNQEPENDVDPTQPSTSPSDGQTVSHGSSQTSSEMQCFNCGGSKVNPHDGKVCSVCGGTGKISVSPTGVPA